MQLVRTGDDAFMLIPYKVATAEQAAPKAAPWLVAQDVSDCALNLCDPDGPHEHGCYLTSPTGAAPQQGAQEPAPSTAADATYHLGACIVEDVLYATVMRKEPGSAGTVTVLLSEKLPVNLLHNRDVIVDSAPQPTPAPLSDAIEHYLESQDALDNREYAGINAEAYEKLIRRRNASRKDLDEALAAQKDTP